MLGREPSISQFQVSWDWFTGVIGDIWQPLLLGCLTVGTITSIASYLLVHILWRLHIISHLKERRLKRLRNLAKKRKPAHD